MHGMFSFSFDLRDEEMFQYRLDSLAGVFKNNNMAIFKAFLIVF